MYMYYNVCINISAVERLIMINRIKNTIFVYIIYKYVYCVYLLCIYKYTHTYSIYFGNIYMHIYIFILLYFINIFINIFNI